MLLAISSKRKCTLAFLQRKLSPERNETEDVEVEVAGSAQANCQLAPIKSQH